MRILEFIKQNCKNVEFHALGDVCDFLKTSTLSKDKLIENGEFPVVNSSKEFYGYYDKFNNDGNTICVASRGNAGFVSYVEQKFWAGGLCYPFRSKNENNINTKFIFYFLKSKENSIISNLVSFGAIPALNKSDLQNFKIPVPSLEVQNKIVEVLDSFSSLVRSLVRSLVLEKTAREKQYKYYLNHLITNARNSRIYKLGEVAKIITGSTPSKSNAEFYGGEIPFYKPADLNFGYYVENSADKISKKGYEISRKLPEKSILVTCIGATIGKVGFIRKAGICNQQINAVLPNENFIPEYIYFCLISDIFQGYIKKYKTSSTMPILNKTNFEKLEIPLPPLDEQERIVRILDSLNELANGLSAGIPKEIELRRKQYEYWRDRLLEFPSKDSK